MKRIRRWLCAIGIHEWEWIGQRFLICTRPECTLVEWWTGETYWDLDVCDTQERYRMRKIQ